MNVEPGLIIEVVGLLIAVGSLVFAILAFRYARDSTILSQEQLVLAKSMDERSQQESELEVEVARPPVKQANLTRSKSPSEPNRYALLVVMDASLRNQSSRNNAVSEPELEYVRKGQKHYVKPASQADKDRYEEPFPSNSALEFNIGSGSRMPISASFYLEPLDTPQQWYKDPPRETAFTMVDNYNRDVRIPLRKVTTLAKDSASQVLGNTSSQ